MRPFHAVSRALLAVGVIVGWVITLVATLYMGVFHLPLSLVQSLLLIVTAPTKVRFRTVPLGLFLWLVVMTMNQGLALIWLLGYQFIKDWAYSTSSGNTISALYFIPSAFVSTALVYKYRHRLYGALS